MASEIAVEVRPSGRSDKLKGFADVTLQMGGDGLLKLSGFSVIQSDNGDLRVVPPARKGEKRYFDVVSLIGPIRTNVDAAVLDEYRRVTERK